MGSQLTSTHSVYDLAQLGFKQVCDEVEEIIAGEDHTNMTDLTAWKWSHC
jgi:hypothetical protein